MKYQVEIANRVREIALERRADGEWQLTVEGEPVAADIAWVDANTVSLLIAGRSWTFALERSSQGEVWIAGAGREATAAVRDPRRLNALGTVEPSGPARLIAPMAGKVVRLLAGVGDAVEAGQGVVVLEAMKMQNEVRSPKSGTLRALAVTAGATVATGALLAEID